VKSPGINWIGWDDVAPIRATGALMHLELEDAVKLIDAEGPLGKPIQLCPQNGASIRSTLNSDLIDKIKAKFSRRNFHLHANHRVIKGPSIPYDASNADTHLISCFRSLAELSQQLSSLVYSVHAGRKNQASRKQLINNICRLERIFNCPVALEGMYPSNKDTFNICTSDDYRWLLHSGLMMAIDVSHLNIVSSREGGLDQELLDELLISDRCLEVHISHNNGIADAHLPLPVEPPWWWSSLVKAITARPSLPVFCESVTR